MAEGLIFGNRRPRLLAALHPRLSISLRSRPKYISQPFTARLNIIPIRFQFSPPILLSAAVLIALLIWTSEFLRLSTSRRTYSLIRLSASSCALAFWLPRQNAQCINVILELIYLAHPEVLGLCRTIISQLRSECGVGARRPQRRSCRFVQFPNSKEFLTKYAHAHWAGRGRDFWG